MTKRNGAAKQRILLALSTSGDSALYSTLLWQYQTISNPLEINISPSTKASFSRTIKALAEEDLITLSEVDVDDLTNDEYLNFAINKSTQDITRKIRSAILPTLFKEHIYSKQAEKNLSIMFQLEEFIMFKDVSVQAPSFESFKNEFNKILLKIDNTLKMNFPRLLKKNDKLFTNLFLRVQSYVNESQTDFKGKDSIYKLLRFAVEVDSSFESILVAYDNLISTHQNVYTRFLRKNLYFNYCTGSISAQGSMWFNPMMTDQFLYTYKKELKGIIPTLDQYKAEQPQGYAKGHAYNSYICNNFLEKIFDSNWCRSRSETLITLNNKAN